LTLQRQLRIAEHTTDTAGFTDLLFGAYDVVGLGFSPRIRDLADQRLSHLDDTKLPTLVASLVPNRVNVELIVAHWDDLLRLGASIHEGAVLPSLVLTKLQAFPRQNALARACAGIEDQGLRDGERGQMGLRLRPGEHRPHIDERPERAQFLG